MGSADGLARMRVRIAAAVAGALLFAIVPGVAAAESACAALGGHVDSERSCELRDSAPGYLVEFSFPTDYPDQQSLADYLGPLKDDFVDFAGGPPPHDWPYTLTVTSATYRSGDAATGTQSLVLTMSQDANPRPVTWYQSFVYDLARGRPITLENLFAAGVDPMDVVYPEVRRELEKRWPPEVFATMVGEVDEDTFADFALTDDAVIFFFGQGRLLGHPDGPLEVSVQKDALGL
jgi:hypothetical protein